MTDEREPLTEAELTQLEYAASRHPAANATLRLIAEVRRLRAEIHGHAGGIHFYLTDELLSDEVALREFIRGEVEERKRNS